VEKISGMSGEEGAEVSSLSVCLRLGWGEEGGGIGGWENGEGRDWEGKRLVADVNAVDRNMAAHSLARGPESHTRCRRPEQWRWRLECCAE
jgi:hypothetical protein